MVYVRDMGKLLAIIAASAFLAGVGLSILLFNLTGAF
jgi:hypothetical protein